MSTLRPDHWQALSPYLDQALAMTDDERTAWLSSLAERDPALAAQVKALLEEHRILAQEGFLEKSPAAPPNAPGPAVQTIGPYTLISQIGQGGMGSVWLAERSDGRFERRVAVKFLSVALSGRGGELRFKREGRILGRLAHEHIAELVDAGVSPAGQPYLVLEYVEGQPSTVTAIGTSSASMPASACSSTSHPSSARARCRTRTTAARTASRRYWTSWRMRRARFSSTCARRSQSRAL